MISDAISPYIPLILGAIGVLLMFPLTLTLYRRFLKAPIADQTKKTFVEAADDEEFVVPLKNTLLWRELTGDTVHQVQLVAARVDSIPSSIGEVVGARLDESAKTLGNHFSDNLDAAVAHIQKRIDAIEERFMTGKRFGNPDAMSPQEAQAKGVEARRVNQIVTVLEEHVSGPTWAAKARELGDFLEAVGQSDLADWLDEHQDKIQQIERKIRANPQLAARLQQMQKRNAGGRGSPGVSEI